MEEVFGDLRKFFLWRELSIILAKARKECGNDITDQQLQEMELNFYKFYFGKVAEEKRKGLDLTTCHLNVFASKCTMAKKVIEFGATSGYVRDNTDAILIKEAFDIIVPKIIRCIDRLSKFAEKYYNLPTVKIIPHRPQQLETFGKRAHYWTEELMRAMEYIEVVRKSALALRGCKGTTVTENQFLEIFNGDANKVKELDQLVTKMVGLNEYYAVTRDISSHNMDNAVLRSLSVLGTKVDNICKEIRLLVICKRMEERFGSTEMGSSASIAHRLSPSELCINLVKNFKFFVGNALRSMSTWPPHILWPRTLDGTTNPRSSIPIAFSKADLILNEFENMCKCIEIGKSPAQELPFLSTNSIIEAMVKKGGDRQECEEKLRDLCLKVWEVMLKDETDNDLMTQIQKEPYFEPIEDQINDIMDAQKSIERDGAQVLHFIETKVKPMIEPYKQHLDRH